MNKAVITQRKDPLFFFYALSLFMVMSIRGNLSFTWDWPIYIYYGFGIIVPICFTVLHPHKRKQSNYIRIIITVIVCYLYFTFVNFSFDAFLVNLTIIISIISIVILPIEQKEKMLSYLATFLAICVGVSLVAWILYWSGFPMSYKYVQYDEFHNLQKFTFFTYSYSLDIIPRFAGMFLEAGQLAEPCALMLFANGGSLKDWRNVVLLIGIILSFSLIGYGLVLLWYGYILLRKNIYATIFCVGLLGSVAFVVYRAAEENNPLYLLILARLEYDEDNLIAGNNRINEAADYEFHKLMRSSECLFGIGNKIGKSNDWTYNVSGYKKFIFHYGLVGFVLVILMVFCCYLKNKSHITFIYFLLAILAFIPRNLLHTPMWIFSVILGFFVIKARNDKMSIATTATPQYPKR